MGLKYVHTLTPGTPNVGKYCVHGVSAFERGEVPKYRLYRYSSIREMCSVIGNGLDMTHHFEHPREYCPRRSKHMSHTQTQPWPLIWRCLGLNLRERAALSFALKKGFGM